MYERHFRLDSKPFAMSPDPAFLYPSAQHEAALTMLEYALESQAPFCVLTARSARARPRCCDDSCDTTRTISASG